MRWIIWILLAVLGWNLFGCSSLLSKDADLTPILTPRAGQTEFTVPAKALDPALDGTFTYRGDPEKNVTIQAWYENGNPKLMASGDRSGVIGSTGDVITRAEHERIAARERDQERLYAAADRLLDRFERIADKMDRGGGVAPQPGGLVPDRLAAARAILTVLDNGTPEQQQQAATLRRLLELLGTPVP